MVVAPSGVPGAGNLYATTDSESGLSVVAPGAASSRSVNVEQPSALGLAPPCTPNAGDVYVAGLSSGTVSGFQPDGSSMLSGVPIGADGSHVIGSTIAVAPAGSASPGLLYVGTGSGVTTVATQEAMTQRMTDLCSALLSAAFVVPRGASQANDVVLVCESGTHTGTGSAVVMDDGASRVLHQFTLDAGTRAGGAAIAPAGLANAGTVYVPNETAGTLAVLRPDGTQSSISLKPGVRSVTVAPAGTKDAGTVYAINGDTGELYVITGTDGRVAATIPVGGGPAAVAVAGPGVPNAGTVYVASYQGGFVTALS